MLILKRENHREPSSGAPADQSLGSRLPAGSDLRPVDPSPSKSGGVFVVGWLMNDSVAVM